MARLYIVTLFISLICEILGWMNHKLESRLPGEISVTSDMKMTSPYWQTLESWVSSCSCLGFKKHFDKIKLCRLIFSTSKRVKWDEYNAWIFEDRVTIVNRNLCFSKYYFIRACLPFWSLECAYIMVWQVGKLIVDSTDYLFNLELQQSFLYNFYFQHA